MFTKGSEIVKSVVHRSKKKTKIRVDRARVAEAVSYPTAAYPIAKLHFRFAERVIFGLSSDPKTHLVLLKQ